MRLNPMMTAAAVLILLLGGSAFSREKAEQGAFGTCTKDGKGYVPATLDAAMVELEKLLGRSGVVEFKKKDPIHFHHGLGTSLRNCWGLWAGGSALGKWFNQKGIQHPDDMSGIILTSFHRRLHKKPIDLDAQIKSYKDYWKKRQDDYEKGTSSGSTIFNLVDFVKGEGWVSVRGEMIPRVDDLVVPLRGHAGKALTACWKKLPKPPGNSAVETRLAIAINKAGRVASAKVLSSAVPAANAACMAAALVGAPVPKHAGASYTLSLQSYRMVEPK